MEGNHFSIIAPKREAELAQLLASLLAIPDWADVERDGAPVVFDAN
jgi:hypothetical protein